MPITLYTAPDCIRCRIVKEFMAEQGLSWETVDFKGEAPTFNAFYRARRKEIYRNPEGVEFPLFDDGVSLKQGSGEVIAYLLSGHDLEGAVTRSDLLHGWISGLYLSQCPAGQEEHFVTLVQALAKGGLSVCVQTDGRKPELLERLVGSKALTKVVLNIHGPALVYQSLFGSAPSSEELGKSVALTRAFPSHELRFLASPIPRADGIWSWPSREEAKEGAALVFAACNDHQMPFGISAVSPEMPQGMHGLDPVPDALLLKYRSAAREFLFKAEINRADV